MKIEVGEQDMSMSSVSSNADEQKKIRNFLDKTVNVRSDPYVEPAPLESDPEYTYKKDGISYELAVTTKRLTRELSTWSILNPVADALWPGALVQGTSLQGGNLAPILIPRAAGEIVVTTNLGQKSNELISHRSIPNPDITSVSNGVRQLITSLNPSESPGAVDFYSNTAHSESQALLSIGADYKSKGTVAGSFNLSKSLEKTSTIVRFTQEYYTVVFNPLNGEFFGDDATLEQLQRYSSHANPPCYISEVAYGRALIMSVNSSKKSEDVKLALNAALGSIGGNIKTEHKDIINESEIRILAVGGKGSGKISLLKDPFNELQNYLQDGARFSLDQPVAPIAFTTRYVKNLRQASITMTAEYNEMVFKANDNVVKAKFSIGEGRDSGDRGETNVRVAEGDKITISAKGEIWAGVALTGKNGPNGWQGKTKDGKFPISDGTASPYMLIGRFGDESWFPIGDSKIIIRKGGPANLHLSINDDNLSNGDKAFEVVVSVERAPLIGAEVG